MNWPLFVVDRVFGRDIDFDNLTIKIKRSFVRGVIYPTKTEASEGTLPLDTDLAEMLLARRTLSPYPTDLDYVFAGDSGKVRWPESMLHDHIKPGPAKAGIGNIGWHSFRHTYSTLLHALGTAMCIDAEPAATLISVDVSEHPLA